MQIEKGVAMPKRRGRGEWDVLETMDPGDSILFDNQREQLLCRDAMRYRKMKYRTAKTHDGYRVWYVNE